MRAHVYKHVEIARCIVHAPRTLHFRSGEDAMRTHRPTPPHATCIHTTRVYTGYRHVYRLPSIYTCASEAERTPCIAHKRDVFRFQSGNRQKRHILLPKRKGHEDTCSVPEVEADKKDTFRFENGEDSMQRL